MKKVVFLAGLPGVGKSTLARKIAERVGGLVLDIDRIKREVVDSKLVTSTIDPPEVRWRCYQRAFEEIQVLLSDGTQVAVVDEVFHLHELRQRLENLCIDADIEVLWVEVVCAYETVKSRLHAHARSGHILSTEEALRMNLLFVEIFECFPSGKENHRVFKNEDECEPSSIVL